MTIYDYPTSMTFIDTEIQHFETSFPQKTLRPFEAKFSMEPPWDVGMNIFVKCSGSHDQDGFQAHIYDKNIQKLPS